MKKLLALLLALTLVFALAACSATEETTTEAPTLAPTPTTEATTEAPTEAAAEAADDDVTAQLQSYIDMGGDDLLKVMEESFAGTSGMTCTSAIEAVDSGLLLTININELENVGEETKTLLQQTFGAMEGSFDPMLKELQEAVPGTKHLTLKICDKDGNELVTICADGNYDESATTPTMGGDDVQAQLQAFIDLGGDTMVKAMEESFAGASGMTCTSTIEVVDNGLLLTIRINDLENVDEATKKQMQDSFDLLQDQFDGILDEIQDSIPGTEHFTIHVCDKNGDMLGSISAKD